MTRKKFDIIEYVLIVGIVIFLNIIAARYFFRIDLTEDKRFSISDTSKEVLTKLDDKIYVDVFLDGELTPSYERLKKSIREKLDEFGIYADDKIHYRFSDPNKIEDKRLRDQFFAQLAQKGVQYRYDRIEEGGKVEEKIIFPSALISSGSKEVPIMFLKGNKTASLDEQLNQSVENVEFELTSAIRKLTTQVDKSVAFVEGHDEFPAENLSDISASLSDYYNVSRITLNDSVPLDAYQTLIIARPIKAYSEKEKFLLDQYVVKGGSVLMLIDPLNLNVDSLMNGYTYAFPYDYNLGDLMFKWGIRSNPDAVQDLNCGLIKVLTGNQNQTEMVNWPFHPILYNYGQHSIVRNLDAITSKYPGSLDTVKAIGIKKTPLVFTTANTKVFIAPLEINLNDTRKSSDPAAYNKGVLPIAYLLEGSFQSLFKNRPSPIAGVPVVKEGKPGKVIVCSDADMIKNEIDKRSHRAIPLGYDIEIQYQFSNKEFVMNAIDYLMGEKIVEIRNKEIKLRPLDKMKINEGKLQWQIINLLLPPVLLILFGFARYYWRKKRFEKN